MLNYGNGVGFAADLSPSGNTVKAPENRPPLKSILSPKGEHLLLHSGASLALTIEQELVKMVIGPEKEAKAADRLRALELLGKSQKVGYFSTNLTVTNVDHMSEEELEEKLQQRLKELFKSTG
jgi:hypothetical protein